MQNADQKAAIELGLEASEARIEAIEVADYAETVKRAEWMANIWDTSADGEFEKAMVNLDIARDEDELATELLREVR